MDKILSALVTYPEVVRLLSDCPHHCDEFLSFALYSHQTLQKNSCCNGILTAVLRLYGIENTELFQELGSRKIKFPSLIHLSYGDYHGIIVCENKRNIFYLDYCDQRGNTEAPELRVSGSEERNIDDPRSPAGGYLFFRMSFNTLTNWLIRLNNPTEACCREFLGYYYPGMEVKLGYLRTYKLRNPMDRLLFAMDEQLTVLIGGIYAQPQNITYALPMSDDSDAHNFEAVETEEIREILVSYDFPNSSYKNPGYIRNGGLSELQTALKEVMEIRLEDLKVRIESVQPLPIITFS